MTRRRFIKELTIEFCAPLVSHRYCTLTNLSRPLRILMADTLTLAEPLATSSCPSVFATKAAYLDKTTRQTQHVCDATGPSAYRIKLSCVRSSKFGSRTCRGRGPFCGHTRKVEMWSSYLSWPGAI
ncbi:uncharacterized protein LOC135200595 [Macrobrachium nipponense]|uniref:uncharacterized protein LOC135200595 n=1 Tax=Macrobrachium nipponense TaxID=159736 RepID=UPI0030C7D0BB